MTTGTMDGPSLEWDPMAQFVGTVAGDSRTPYPGFHAKRRDTPVEERHNLSFDGSDTGETMYYVYRYDDVATVLRDNVTYCSGGIREMLETVMGPYPLVGMDEPEHKRLRSLVAQAFRQKTLAHWNDDLVGPVVDATIDTFVERGEAELVREFTFLYPVQVIGALLGLPREDYQYFQPRALALTNVAAQPAAGLRASAELREYFEGILEARRREPRGDLISELVNAELDGERLGDEEIFSFLRLLLPAGAETTYRATGNFLFGLLTHRDQFEALAADRTLMTQAIEETIRWESPLTITSRTSTRASELAGVTIPAGANVVAGVGSANHDPSRWSDPDVFDIFQPVVPHIAFGVGLHMCLGMHLARMEMATAVNRLIDRCPNLRFDEEAFARDDAHIHGENFRSPTTLPVLFDPA
ncbi:MAG TPA: cytochrome P450 [Acidimicrobiia bacterium]|nr:cytochrome P450 [Acidimicrobiia bacterium]